MSALVDLTGRIVHDFGDWFQDCSRQEAVKTFWVGGTQLKAYANPQLDELTLLAPYEGEGESQFDFSWSLPQGKFVYLPNVWPKPIAWFCKPQDDFELRVGRWAQRRKNVNRHPDSAVAYRTRAALTR
jgi:hypothetical protein